MTLDVISLAELPGVTNIITVIIFSFSKDCGDHSHVKDAQNKFSNVAIWNCSKKYLFWFTSIFVLQILQLPEWSCKKCCMYLGNLKTNA